MSTLASPDSPGFPGGPGLSPATAEPRYPAGITRLQRWERAQELGLSPPGPIRDALLEHRDNPDVTYRWVWDGMGWDEMAGGHRVSSPGAPRPSR